MLRIGNPEAKAGTALWALIPEAWLLTEAEPATAAPGSLAHLVYNHCQHTATPDPV